MIKKAKLSLQNKNKNIQNIRNNIDKIDTQILKYLSLRRKEVLKITKYKTRSEIVDKKRISQIIRILTKKGKKFKIEAFIIKNIWGSMIKSFIALEKKKI